MRKQRVDPEVREEILEMGKKAVLVQKRIAFAHSLVVSALEERPLEAKAPRQAKRDEMRETVLKSGHWLIPSWKSALRCRRCRQGGSKADMWKWIRNEGHTCRGIRKATHNAQNEVAFPGKSVDAIKVGRVALHTSHTLASANGVWFCTAYGAYVTAAEGKKSSAKLLALPCNAVKPP